MNSKENVNKFIKNFMMLFEAFAEVIFCSGWLLGSLIILLTFCNPNIAGAGIISFFSLFIFFIVIGKDVHYYKRAAYFFNPVLVGMSIGAIFELSSVLILIIFVASILTFLLTVCLVKFFDNRGIPVLSLPFAIVSTGFYLAAAGYNRLFFLALYDRKMFSGLEEMLPDFIAHFFKATGTIVFMPNVVAGAVIFLLILYTSRILAIHALVAFFAGAFVHSQLSVGWSAALADPYAFNYILVGLALGGTYLLPSVRSSMITLLAIGVTAILIDITSGFALAFRIPVFTIPFNMTVIIFAAALKMLNYGKFNYDIRYSPEMSLSTFSAYRKRFKPGEAVIALPFTGKAAVFQAENGESTHQGKWRYAFDFVGIHEECMYSGNGSNLEDYYIYNRDILSPVSGYIVNCLDSLPDNEPGKLDHVNNWGNYIIIRDLYGNFIEISHIKQHSLQVKMNDYVYLGQCLASCGNSGYSSFPHIHVQAQKSFMLGDETLPFNFALYSKENEIIIQGHPEKNEVIESVLYSEEFLKNFNFTIEAVYEFDVYENQKSKSKTTFKVKRTQDARGLVFLEDEKGSRLYYAVKNGTFHIYDYIGKNNSYLKILYAALPRIPLINKTKFTYQEYLPLHIVYSKWKFACFSIINWLIPNYIQPYGEWEYFHEEGIKGKIKLNDHSISTRVKFSNDELVEVTVGNIQLKKRGKK